MSASTVVRAKGRNSSPARPGTSVMGRNTSTATTVAETTALATSVTASTMVAKRLLVENPRWRTMFSMTTMESSTMRPMASVRPASAMMLMVVLVASIPMNANSRDSGIEMAVMSVGRSAHRNRKITTTANASPHAPSVASPLMDSSMNGAWSKTMVNSVLDPMDSAVSSRMALTPSESSTKLALVAGVMSMVIDSRPSVRDTDSDSAVVRSTAATSPSATGAASAAAGTMIISANSSTVSKALPTVTSNSTEPSVTLPPGSSRPASSRAERMSAWVTDAWAIAASSRVSCTISSAAPTNCTVATPVTDPMSGRAVRFRRRANSGVSRSEATETIIAGRSPEPPVMTWVVVPSGSCDSTREIRASACDAAR